MITTVNSSLLRDASRLAGKIAMNKSSLPILQHARLYAHQQSVGITGTDLDSYMTVIIPAHTDTPGMVCVPSKRLTEVASSSKGEDIELAMKEDCSLVIRNGGVFTLPTLPASEFPVEPDMNGGESIMITADEIQNAVLARVIPEPSIEVMMFRNGDWISFLFGVGKLAVKLTTNVQARKTHAQVAIP